MIGHKSMNTNESATVAKSIKNLRAKHTLIPKPAYRLNNFMGCHEQQLKLCVHSRASLLTSLAGWGAKEPAK
jgi:hypothetical protein